MTDTATLHPAYRWTCPGCGEFNAADPCPAELDADDRREALAAGFDPYQLECIPPSVECRRCGREFATRDARATAV